MHARREQTDVELRAQLANVLTPDQLARFDEMHKRQRPHRPPPGEASQQAQ